MEITQGHLLGGRVRYAQPRDGYRTGIEPVLLAAAVPARPGQRVLEAGTGAGAGLLCLAARAPGVQVVGVELDPEMAELARRNLSDNGVAGAVVAADIATVDLGRFDHAFANPPWHDKRATPSPLPRRRLAKQGGVLELWVAALARLLQPGGTLSLILPATQTARASAALDAAAHGRITVLPLLPKADRPVKLTILRGQAGDGSVQTCPEIVLHEASGAFTAAIEAVLRHGAALPQASG